MSAEAAAVTRSGVAAPSRARIALDLLRGGQEHRYAAHSSGRCELHLPRRSAVPPPVAVLLHGGSWRARYGKALMRPLCADLVRRGWAAWNVEYRRIGRGQGGGWPATFQDVTAAIEQLARGKLPVDLDRVVLIGHSAGGQLALWAAARDGGRDGGRDGDRDGDRPTAGADHGTGDGEIVAVPTGPPLVHPRAVVAQAPVANLERGRRLVAPGGLVNDLLGGSPDEVPERYAQANPIRRVPLPVPALLVHSPGDGTVGVGHSREYAAAARAAGASVELVEPPGGHRDHIDPRSHAWAEVAARLDGLVA